MCPCDSGKTYRECCKKRKIRWIKNEKGDTYREVRVKLEDEYAQIITKFMKSQEIKFKKKFKREMTGEDYLFFDTEEDEKEILDKMIKAAKKACVEPEKIYALKKTRFVLSEVNYKQTPTPRIKEWIDAINEYRKLVAQGIDPLEEPVARKEVVELFECLPKTIDVLSYTIKRLIYKKVEQGSVYDEYLMFYLEKTCQNLKATMSLTYNELGPDALGMTRAIYENYLSIAYLKKNPDRMRQIFEAKLGLEQGTFEAGVVQNGRLDKNKAREKKTGKVVTLNIPKGEMARNSGYTEDGEIHESLYSFLSGFTHTDISVMGSYFGDSEVRGIHGIEAVILALLYTTLIIDEAVKGGYLTGLCERDFEVCVNENKKVLKNYFGENAKRYRQGGLILKRIELIGSSD
ncbi:Uncharacterised protein [uncultured archaeon]|nr:Uncharacterised protein [uncultured archaeon]